MPNIRLAAITITAALVTVLGSTTIAQEPPPERESLENAYKEDSFSPHAALDVLRSGAIRHQDAG